MNVTVTRASPTLLTVASGYDPLVIAAIKSVTGRTWNKPNRVWLIPSTPESIEKLKKLLPRYATLRVETTVLAELDAAAAGMTAAAAVRAAGDSDIAFDYVTEPYAHQRAGLEFLVKLGSGALLWEMGLGKTKTAIDYAEWLYQRYAEDVVNPAVRSSFPRMPAVRRFRVLVICPNTVKRNWLDELYKHAKLGRADVSLPAGTLSARATGIANAPGRYTIVNCEQLSFGTTARTLAAVSWDLVIVDESTRFKTPGAARTKALHKLKAGRRLILTGTPITGKPEDAWAQLEFVSPGLFGSFYAFKDRYLELDWFKKVVGIKANAAEELKERIGRRSYRILKADVLDLPPKVYATRTVELGGDQKKAYNQMKEELRIDIENAPKLSASNILTMLLRLTQVTAGMVGERGEYLWLKDNAKLVELDNLLNDELAGEQVVIFGQYQFELEQLARRYAPTGLYVDAEGSKREFQPIIYGPTPEPIRHRIIEEFQDGRRRLLFCQIRTGGIGINLTAAQTAIYVTRSWSLEEWLQSQDRLHRIGQQGTVSILSLVAKDTIDEEIAKALAEKQDVADYLTGDSARKLAARLLT